MEEMDITNLVLDMMPVGSCAPVSILIDGKYKATCLTIKDSKSILKGLKSPLIQVSYGLLCIDEVYVFIGLFNIVSLGTIYEVYFNYYAIGEHMEQLTKQDFLCFAFYDEEKKCHCFTKINNKVYNYFKDSINRIKKVPVWSMEQFDEAKYKISKIYTVSDLWSNFGNDSEQNLN